MTSLRHPHRNRQRQRGAAFIVMLVIMIMGLSFYLVSALSKVSLQTARNEASSDMLAQAKEVVIGYMLEGGSNSPGWMALPDVLDLPSSTEKSPATGLQASNYDGEWENNCLDSTNPEAFPPYAPLTTSPLTSNLNNRRCFGRLPWKSLGMSISSPSENDPTGFMPWYAFSRNLRNLAPPINSEMLNSAPYPWLKVYDMKGALLSDRVAFVLIIPGPALSYQTRPPSPGLANPDQYLDKISLPAGCTGAGCTTTYRNYDLTEIFVTGDEHRWMADPADPTKQIEDPTYQFNDKLLYVTIDDLMPLIEKRIAREVKACLDDYANVAGNTGHKYPWAALVSDTSTYPDRVGTYDVRFGRISETPNTSTTSPSTPPSGALLTYLNNVQTALNNYLANPNSTTLSILRGRGDTLKDNTLSGTAAHTAGVIADGCTSSSCDTTALQNNLNIAFGLGTPNPTMPSTWSSVASCKQLFIDSSYWPDWRDLVFYQIADGFQPTGSGSCTASTTCLSVSGSGNTSPGNGTYQAVVMVAGKKLLGQNRPSTANPPSDYLEAAGSNNHNSSAGATPSVNFTTYKPSDAANYSTVNDVIVCVDGKNNCK